MKVHRFLITGIILWMNILSAKFFELPTELESVFCTDDESIEQTMTAITNQRKISVGIITFDINQDSYLALYTGALMHIMKHILSKNAVMVFLESISLASRIKFLSMLPEDSMMILVEHGNINKFGLKQLVDIISHHPIKPMPIIHLNHEQPWSNMELGYFHESIPFPIEDVIRYYHMFPIVYRNYFYEPLINHSTYFPVGFPYRGHILYNQSNSIHQYALNKPYSNRILSCHFVGRTIYVKTILHEQKDERQYLLKLHQSGKITPCIFSTMTSAHQGQVHNLYDYDSYIQLMSEVGFALCPAGNNPETFRIYEALELGAIPIFVRPAVDKDFTRYGLWKNYPGPIFSTWDELQPFISTITTSEADHMQIKVRKWYEEFKRDSIEQMKSKLQPFLSSRVRDEL